MRIIVITGPSGSGKSTLLQMLINNNNSSNFDESIKQKTPEKQQTDKTKKILDTITPTVSCTTRKSRPGEIDGKDYYFIDRDQFKKYIDDDMFMEYEEYNNNLYGILKSELFNPQNDQTQQIQKIQKNEMYEVDNTYNIESIENPELIPDDHRINKVVDVERKGFIKFIDTYGSHYYDPTKNIDIKFVYCYIYCSKESIKERLTRRTHQSLQTLNPHDSIQSLVDHNEIYQELNQEINNRLTEYEKDMEMYENYKDKIKIIINNTGLDKEDAYKIFIKKLKNEGLNFR